MKYIELFKDGFDSTIDEKTKPENWPYVGYSPREGVVFTVIPEPIIGPTNNEIWYTSSDGNVVTPYVTDVFGANIVSNTYKDDKGVIVFDGPITNIGGDAFYCCEGLTSVVIPDSVTSIGSWAFSDCSYLTPIVIPDGVTSIGEYAFENCISLTSIVIPNSVTSIGECAFNCCFSLTSITFEGTMEEWNSIPKGGSWNS